MTSFELSRNTAGRLVLRRPGEAIACEGVVPVRAFPIAAPDSCIALVGPDGRELAWIESLDQLPAPVRALIEEELAGRDFLPEISRLRAVSAWATPCTWEVDTDRGPTQFVLKSEEDIRRIGAATLLISDSHGIQYLIRDLTRLDRGSRNLLDRFL